MHLLHGVEGLDEIPPLLLDCSIHHSCFQPVVCLNSNPWEKTLLDMAKDLAIPAAHLERIRFVDGHADALEAIAAWHSSFPFSSSEGAAEGAGAIA